MRLSRAAATAPHGSTSHGASASSTRQLAAILQRRLAEAGNYQPGVRDWVFPSPTSATGHVQDPHHLYGRISETGGAKFWFHGLRNCFITVAERELMLPHSLTKRLVNGSVAKSGWLVTCLRDLERGVEA